MQGGRRYQHDGRHNRENAGLCKEADSISTTLCMLPVCHLSAVDNNEGRQHAQPHHLLLGCQPLLPFSFQAQVALLPQQGGQVVVAQGGCCPGHALPRHVIKVHNPPAVVPISALSSVGLANPLAPALQCISVTSCHRLLYTHLIHMRTLFIQICTPLTQICTSLIQICMVCTSTTWIQIETPSHCTFSPVWRDDKLRRTYLLALAVHTLPYQHGISAKPGRAGHSPSPWEDTCGTMPAWLAACMSLASKGFDSVSSSRLCS